jgi:3-methyladenine DNA glycosylase/8-oxoguanine DNA glycosylase
LRAWTHVERQGIDVRIRRVPVRGPRYDAPVLLAIYDEWRTWRAYATLHLWRRLEEKPI